MKHVQAFEIKIASIHQVEGIGFRHNRIEDIDIVQFSIGNLNESGYWTSQVQ